MKNNKRNENKICSRCICDTTIPEIQFDEDGICQFCKIHDILDEMFPINEIGGHNLKKLLEKIKKDGKGKEYDCIVGVSGGTDSTFTLKKAVEVGLRPLAVHFDNGWDSEIAVRNIKNTIKKLDIDLETYVVDWEEYKDLQKSFLKASVSDAEIPTDYGITGVLYKVAKEEKIKYILHGRSFRNEGLVPISWTYMDMKYIKNVHKKFGAIKLKSYPGFSLWDIFYLHIIKGLKLIPFLNYFEYKKVDVKKMLKKELNWEDYGGHHHESIFTIFFQSYYLPHKFNIDKRKVEYSAFIRSGQMKREDALYLINNNPYPYDEDIIKYTLSKLCLSQEDFDKIMVSKNMSFTNYSNYYRLLQLFKLPIKIFYHLRLIPELMYLKYLY